MFGIVNSSSSTKALTSILLLSFFAISCDSKKPASHCNYDIVDTMAEITDMKPHADGNGRVAVVLDFKASVLALEDQELGDLKSISIDHDFIVRNNLEIGNQYSVVVSQIIDGDCTPRIVSFNHGFE